jgi:hypothetical protein
LEKRSEFRISSRIGEGILASPSTANDQRPTTHSKTLRC